MRWGCMFGEGLKEKREVGGVEWTIQSWDVEGEGRREGGQGRLDFV